MIDRGERRAEAEVVLAPRDLELLVGGKEPANLLERLRRNDQVAAGAPLGLDRHLHLRQAMAVRRHHPHLSGFSSQSTPFRIGRLSSVLTANDVCEISFCRSPERIRQLSSNRTTGKLGNSSRGRPRILKCERPQSSVTRCSPAAAIFTGDGGSSRAISLSFLAGIVIAPVVSTSARTSVLTAISRSVPESRIPLSVVSDQDIRQNGQRGLGGNARRDCRQPFLQLLPGDREPHHRSCVPRYVQSGAGYCSTLYKR